MRPALRAFKIVLGLVVLLLILILLVLPITTGLLINHSEVTPKALQKYLRSTEFAQVWAMRFVVVTWCFFLGSCFASFLNVVAWRVPRGRSILGSSYCPHCDSKLSFIRDNVPVLGWILNSGQCRNCKQRISPRYLIVEMILGAVFLLLMMATLWGGGITLPLREPNAILRFERSLFEPKWDLIQILGYQLVMLCFLFTFGLIRSDHLRIPKSVFAFAIGFGVALPLIWPAMHLADYQPLQTAVADFSRFSVRHLLTLLIGSVVGLLLGQIVDRFYPSKEAPMTMTYCFGVVGLYLGFQSVISVALIWCTFTIITETIRPSSVARTYAGVNLFLAVIVHLLTWRLGTQIGYWPSPASAPFQIGTGITLTMLLLAFLAWKCSKANSVTKHSHTVE